MGLDILEDPGWLVKVAQTLMVHVIVEESTKVQSPLIEEFFLTRWSRPIPFLDLRVRFCIFPGDFMDDFPCCIIFSLIFSNFQIFHLFVKFGLLICFVRLIETGVKFSPNIPRMVCSVNNDTEYYTDDRLNEMSKSISDDNLSMLNVNIRSICKNLDSLKDYLHCCNIRFNVIGIAETRLNDKPHDYFQMNGYNLELHNRDNNRGGGVCLYMWMTKLITVYVMT